MQRDPQVYTDAAKMLWDLAPEQLSALASGRAGASQGVRDAAHMALGVKREFLAPEEFGSEQAALDRLGANLAMLPDFSLQEIALACGRGPVRQMPRPTTVALEPKNPTRRRVLRVALVTLVLLLVLEALAMAGLPVPSPIGTVVENVGGEPRSLQAPGGPEAAVDDLADATDYNGDFLPLPAADIAKQRTAVVVTKPKNENHARGRRLHFAQGRDSHKPSKDDKKTKKTKKTKASATGRERPERPDLIDKVTRAVARATNGTLRAQRPHRNGKGRGRGPK